MASHRKLFDEIEKATKSDDQYQRHLGRQRRVGVAWAGENATRAQPRAMKRSDDTRLVDFAALRRNDAERVRLGNEIERAISAGREELAHRLSMKYRRLVEEAGELAVKLTE